MFNCHIHRDFCSAPTEATEAMTFWPSKNLVHGLVVSVTTWMLSFLNHIKIVHDCLACFILFHMFFSFPEPCPAHPPWVTWPPWPFWHRSALHRARFSMVASLGGNSSWKLICLGILGDTLSCPSGKWIWIHFRIYDHVGILFMPSMDWFKGKCAGNIGFYPALNKGVLKMFPENHSRIPGEAKKDAVDLWYLNWTQEPELIILPQSITLSNHSNSSKRPQHRCQGWWMMFQDQNWHVLQPDFLQRPM